MKIAIGVDKEFAVETEVKLVVLEFVVVDGIDAIEKFDGADKHRGIVLS